MSVNDFDVTGSYSDPGSLLAESVQDFGFIPIGRTRRPLSTYLDPAQIERVADLPAQLFLGSIDGESFCRSATGWSVRYVDSDPQTSAEASYSAGKNQLIVKHVWHGIEGAVSHTTGSWREATRYGGVFSARWSRYLENKVSKQYNVRVAEDPSDGLFQYVHNFPEGFWVTLLCPVPAQRLLDLVTLLNELDADADIAGEILIYVIKTPSRIEYVRGRCHDIPTEPIKMVAYSRRCTGLPCLEMPQWVNMDGLSILRVTRTIYLAHITCPLRDLDRVLAHGHRLGLLSPNVGDNHLSEYPYGIEWAWYLLPGKLMHKSRQIRVYDMMPSRQVKYWDLLPSRYDKLIQATASIGRKTALGLAAFGMATAAAEEDDLSPANLGDIEIATELRDD